MSIMNVLYASLLPSPGIAAQVRQSLQFLAWQVSLSPITDYPVFPNNLDTGRREKSIQEKKSASISNRPQNTILKS